jgi:hypothetical protein
VWPVGGGDARVQLVRDPLQQGLLAGDLGGLVGRDEPPQGHEQPHDLFLAHLHGSPDAMVRWPGDLAGLDHGAVAPRPRVDVHVELLEGSGPNQVRPPAEDAAGLRPADGLAAGVGDEVGPFRDEAAQVRLGRQGGRGVHDHGQAVPMRDLAHLGQGNGARCALEGDGDADRPWTDRRLDLPGVRPTAAGIPLGAHVDDPRARGAEGMVVRIAMAGLDEDLVGHAVRERQAVDPHGIGAREHCGGRQREARRCTCGHEAGSRASRLGDDCAGPFLELVDGEVELRRFRDGGGDLRVHAMAADARRRSAGVDDGAKPQVLDGAHETLPCMLPAP